MKFIDFLFRYLKPNNLTGIVIHQEGTNFKFSLVELKKRKGKIEIVSFFDSLEFNEIKEKLNKNSLISVFFQLGNTLEKEIEMQSFTEVNQLLDDSFPNLNKDKFWIELYKIESKIGVTIASKKEIDQVLEKFVDLGIFPFHVFIGTKILEIVGDSNFNFFKQDKEIPLQPVSKLILSLKQNLINATWNGIEIENQKLLPFIVGLNGLLAGNSSFKLNHLNGYSFIYNYLSKKLLTAFLFIIFFLLVVNTVIFKSFQTEAETLNSNLSGRFGKYSGIEEKESEILKKEQIIKDLSLDKNLTLSVYCDGIAETIPESIVLKSLNLFPISEFFKKKSNNKYERLIEITGISINDIEFETWVENLKQLKWVEKILIEGFEFVPDENQSKFKIILNVY